MRDAIHSLKVGEDGYPFIFDDKGDMLIHPTLEGKNAYNIRSEDGQYIIQKMIKDKQGKIEYEWKDPDGNIRKKLTIFSDIPEKDLILAMSAYEDEHYALLYIIRNVLIIAFFEVSSYGGQV